MSRLHEALFGQQNVPFFQIGPDQPEDLRQLRPYFVVPIDDPQFGEAADRIITWSRASAKEETSLLLRIADIQNVQDLVRKLLDRNNQRSRYIRDRISCDTLRLLNIGNGAVSQTVSAALVSELNALLRGEECFWDEEHFKEVLTGLLRQQIDEWLSKPAKDREPQERIRFNRKVLELTYPDEIKPSPPKGPVTDVVVLSHGWHRNFFAAVEAYDKVMTGVQVLMHRERISRPEPYHPLFLALHWNSDPAEDSWEDGKGRRHMTSFLDNVARVFERPSAEVEQHLPPSVRFISVFEDIFQFFSRMSAPGSNALTDPTLKEQAKTLAGRLQNFYLRNAATAEPADKVAAAWTCYCQATPKGVLLDQDHPPQQFIGLLTAVTNFVIFVVKGLGLAVVLTFLWKAIPLIGELWSIWVRNNGWLQKVEEGFSRLTLLQNLAAWWVHTTSKWEALFISFALALAFLSICALLNWQKKNRLGVWFFTILLLAWAYSQTLCALPLFLYSLFTYFFASFVPPFWRAGGGFLPRGLLLFDERYGNRDKEFTTTPKHWLKGIRHWLAWLARIPLTLFRHALSKDSWALPYANELDNQLAFWEMQVKAVVAGSRAAAFLAPLFQKLQLKNVRIHFLGHSFGALLVANAVRHLTLQTDLAQMLSDLTAKPKAGQGDYSGKFHTLCLLQGALGSAWFDGEEKMLFNLNGSLACIHSRYDTANGFYYPVANHGRLAAGYVGLFLRVAGRCLFLPEKKQTGRFSTLETEPKDQGLFASIVEPPDLKKELDHQAPDHKGPWIVNLDASRLVYEGSVSTGGGHGDVFKNDLVHLMWAVTRLEPEPKLPAQTRFGSGSTVGWRGILVFGALFFTGAWLFARYLSRVQDTADPN